LLRLVTVIAPFVVCALLYLPTLSGAFLSDDYAVLGALSGWAKSGALWAQLLHKFYSGLDAPSNYYRPLTLLSFASSYALWGAEPLGWRAVNLCLHLASGALIFAILRNLVPSRPAARPVVGPAIGAAIFLLFPASPEAVAWVSGRYDLLAVFFVLASIFLFLRSVRWTDAWGIAALCAAACAFASKESAVLVPAVVTAFAIARHTRDARPVRRGLQNAAPWIALTLRI
jgi:hypothetical protein